MKTFESACHRNADIHYDNGNLTLIFFFFLGGAAACQSCGLGSNVLDSIWFPAFFFAPLLSAVLFSGFVFGASLIPFFALLFGAVTGACTAVLAQELIEGVLLHRGLFFVVIATVPVFFLLAVRSMHLSQVLSYLFMRQDVEARRIVLREFLLLLGMCLAAGLLIFFL